MEYDDFLDFVLFVCSSRNTKKQQNSSFFGVSAAADEQSEIKKIVIFHNHLFPSSSRNPFGYLQLLGNRRPREEAYCGTSSVFWLWGVWGVGGGAVLETLTLPISIGRLLITLMVHFTYWVHFPQATYGKHDD